MKMANKEFDIAMREGLANELRRVADLIETGVLEYDSSIEQDKNRYLFEMKAWVNQPQKSE